LSLLRCKYTSVCNKLSDYINKYDGEIKQEYLKQVCYNLPYSTQLLQSFLDHGAIMTPECMNIICSNAPASSIDMILTCTRMPIQKEQFDQIFIKNTQYVFKTCRSPYSSLVPDISDKIDILIKHGYQLTYEDIVTAAKYRIEIPKIEQYNIKLDKNFLELCWDYDFYPKNYKFDEVEPKLLELQELCASRKKVEISKLIKINNLVPDRRCMENACKFANNIPIVTLLQENGGKITYKCIKNCAEELKNNSMLLKLLNDYEKLHNQELEIHYNQIKSLEEKMSILSQNMDEYKRIHIDKKSKICKKTSPKSTIDDENNENMELIKTEAKTELIEIDDIDDDLLGDIVNPLTIVEINEGPSAPKQKRTKVKIPKRYAEYFKIDTKTKISFMDLKKDFVEKIRQNKWYNEDNQQLIKIPNDLNQKLKIENGYVKFSDIEKLCGRFYD
jgi:hypothetical protein